MEKFYQPYLSNSLNYLLQQLKKELSNLTLLNSFTKIVSSTLFDKEPNKTAPIQYGYKESYTISL